MSLRLQSVFVWPMRSNVIHIRIIELRFACCGDTPSLSLGSSLGLSLHCVIVIDYKSQSKQRIIPIDRLQLITVLIKFEHGFLPTIC